MDSPDMALSHVRVESKRDWDAPTAGSAMSAIPGPRQTFPAPPIS